MAKSMEISGLDHTSLAVKGPRGLRPGRWQAASFIQLPDPFPCLGPHFCSFNLLGLQNLCPGSCLPPQVSNAFQFPLFSSRPLHLQAHSDFLLCKDESSVFQGPFCSIVTFF